MKSPERFCGLLLIFLFAAVMANITFHPQGGTTEQNFNSMILGFICAGIGMILLIVDKIKISRLRASMPYSSKKP